MLNDKELQIARVTREFTVEEAARYWVEESPQDYEHIKQTIEKGCRKIQNPERQGINGDFDNLFTDYYSREELIRLAGELNEELPRFLATPTPNTKPEKLDPRKETTLYCLIAVLAKKAGCSTDNNDTVGKVSLLFDRAGVNMDKKTIRTHIRTAFQTLEEKRE